MTERRGVRRGGEEGSSTQRMELKRSSLGPIRGSQGELRKEGQTAGRKIPQKKGNFKKKLRDQGDLHLSLPTCSISHYTDRRGNKVEEGHPA